MKVSVVGSSGRMGELVLRLIAENSQFELHSKLNSKSDLSECLGADLVIDMTKPDVSETVVDYAIDNDLRLLVGTSGWTKEKIDRVAQRLEESKASIHIVPNFSIGSVLATKFAAEAAKYFDDIEITEIHHISKIDAPSGTALFTSQLISKARENRPSTSKSPEPRFNGIPIQSLREEGVSAEQEVVLRGPHEILTLNHEVDSHEVYAKGILLAMTKAQSLQGLTLGLLPLLRED